MAYVVEHKCPEYERVNPTTIRRDQERDRYGYGRALDGHAVQVDHGPWMMGNGEYWIFVTYCPYCGVKLEDV